MRKFFTFTDKQRNTHQNKLQLHPTNKQRLTEDYSTLEGGAVKTRVGNYFTFLKAYKICQEFLK